MQFEIIQPTEALRPYITRYVFVRADGSTDTMTPPQDDPRFVDGKHVQPLLPNYGSLVFMRNVLVDFSTHEGYDHCVCNGVHTEEDGSGFDSLFFGILFYGCR